MRILLLANVNSSHTRKWCLALKKAGLSVALFSIDPDRNDAGWTNGLDAVSISPFRGRSLFRYLPLHFRLRKMIRQFRPDILHSHYLTNYTLLGVLSGFPRHIATAWGSDVLLFPVASIFARRMLQFNLLRAEVVVSTSSTMAAAIRRYTTKEVEVIPFGVDFKQFRPAADRGRNEEVVIGCFKHLEPVYAHDILLEAFALLRRDMPGTRLRLLLGGDGSRMAELRELAGRLGIAHEVTFAGKLSPEQVSYRMQEVSICVYLSRRESFGVSLIEAMACRIPMVLTRTEGFLEVAGSGGMALFTAFDDPREAAQNMKRLITDPGLYASLAEKAYAHARAHYDLDENIARQVRLYRRMLG